MASSDGVVQVKKITNRRLTPTERCAELLRVGLADTQYLRFERGNSRRSAKWIEQQRPSGEGMVRFYNRFANVDLDFDELILVRDGRLASRAPYWSELLNPRSGSWMRKHACQSGNVENCCLNPAMRRLRWPRVVSVGVEIAKSKSSLNRKKDAWILLRQVPPLNTNSDPLGGLRAEFRACPGSLAWCI